jgi:hypothetical protein
MADSTVRDRLHPANFRHWGRRNHCLEALSDSLRYAQINATKSSGMPDRAEPPFPRVPVDSQKGEAPPDRSISHAGELRTHA